jgi:hypothetical protein
MAEDLEQVLVMDDLKKALGLLEGKLGKFDNIKLILNGSDSMTRETVDAELLDLASKVACGEISEEPSLGEGKLREIAISL